MNSNNKLILQYFVEFMKIYFKDFEYGDVPSKIREYIMFELQKNVILKIDNQIKVDRKKVYNKINIDINNYYSDELYTLFNKNEKI